MAIIPRVLPNSYASYVTIFSLYEKVTILFLLPYSIFWLLFYCYIIYTINNLKNDLEEYI